MLTHRTCQVPLSLSFIGAGEVIEQLAIHLHEGFQHIVHQCYNGPATKMHQRCLTAGKVLTYSLNAF